MTMLNAAPTATAGPTGASTPVAPSTAAPRPAPAPARPLPVAGREAKASEDVAAELRLLGSGSAEAPAVVAAGAGQTAVQLDQFAKQSGPDATVQTAAGVMSVHAVFQFDSKTRKVSVAIVNADGQLVRMIPPESVSAMITAMSTYRGR